MFFDANRLETLYPFVAGVAGLAIVPVELRPAGLAALERGVPSAAARRPAASFAVPRSFASIVSGGRPNAMATMRSRSLGTRGWLGLDEARCCFKSPILPSIDRSAARTQHDATVI